MTDTKFEFLRLYKTFYYDSILSCIANPDSKKDVQQHATANDF